MKFDDLADFLLREYVSPHGRKRGFKQGAYGYPKGPYGAMQQKTDMDDQDAAFLQGERDAMEVELDQERLMRDEQLKAELDHAMKMFEKNLNGRLSFMRKHNPEKAEEIKAGELIKYKQQLAQQMGII